MMNFYKALIFSMPLMFAIDGHAVSDDEPFEPVTVSRKVTVSQKPSLTFTGNIIPRTPCVFRTLDQICDAIEDCGALQSVNFYDIDFSTSMAPEAFEKVCGLLCQKNTIEKLEISNASISTKDISFLLPVLENNIQIDELNLGGNSICAEGVVEIIKLWVTRGKSNKVSLLGFYKTAAIREDVNRELRQDKTFMNSIKTIELQNTGIKITNPHGHGIRVLLSDK